MNGQRNLIPPDKNQARGNLVLTIETNAKHEGHAPKEHLVSGVPVLTAESFSGYGENSLLKEGPLSPSLDRDE